MASSFITNLTKTRRVYTRDTTMRERLKPEAATAPTLPFEMVCPSPRSTIESISSPPGRTKRKSVTFVRDEVLVEVIAPKITLTEDDVSSLWYTKEEYELSKKSQLFIIKMMERGMGSLECDDELCSRGLETRTRTGARRKRQSIEASWDAVLGEQEKQWREGRFSSFALARVCLESAAQNAMVAFLAAKKDAEFVHGATNRPTRSQSEKTRIRGVQRQNSSSSTRSK